MVTAGLATDEEIDRHLGNVATGRLDLATAPHDLRLGAPPLSTLI